MARRGPQSSYSSSIVPRTGSGSGPGLFPGARSGALDATGVVRERSIGKKGGHDFIRDDEALYTTMQTCTEGQNVAILRNGLQQEATDAVLANNPLPMFFMFLQGALATKIDAVAEACMSLPYVVEAACRKSWNILRVRLSATLEGNDRRSAVLGVMSTVLRAMSEVVTLNINRVIIAAPALDTLVVSRYRRQLNSSLVRSVSDAYNSCIGAKVNGPIEPGTFSETTDIAKLVGPSQRTVIRTAFEHHRHGDMDGQLELARKQLRIARYIANRILMQREVFGG